MPTIKIAKESLEGPKRIPPGIYWVRFDGFNPQPTKEATRTGDLTSSINLLPDLKIVNNSDFHDRKPGKEWLNSNAGWVLRDFSHCFGVPLAGTAEAPELPGEFVPPDEPDPSKWRYQGPYIGRTGQVELTEVYGQDGKGPYINIKRYLCAIPGCKENHIQDLTSRG